MLDAEGVLDYAELVHRCRILLADPDVVSRLRAELGLGVRRRVPGHRPGPGPAAAGRRRRRPRPGRGRRPRPVHLRLPRRRGPRASSTSRNASAPATGRPLRCWRWPPTRRFGPVLLAASRNLARRLGIPRALPADVFAGFRRARVRPRASPAGQVEVFTCVSPGAEAEHIAEILRRAHLRDGLPWDEMAVLVRAGRSTIPGADPGPDRRRRARRGGRRRDPARRRPGGAPAAAGPAGGGPRLRGHAGRGPGAAQLAARRDGQHGRAPARPGPARRRAGRAGRDRAAPVVGRADRRALRHPDRLAECGDRPEVAAARRLADLLGGARAASGGGRTAEEALWRSGRAPTGRSGCGRRPPAPARPVAGPTATWTRSVRCSTSRPAARRSSGPRGARPGSWPRSRPSRSRPTRCARPTCAARRSGC